MFEGFPEAADNDPENRIPVYSEEEKVNIEPHVGINETIVFFKHCQCVH